VAAIRRSDIDELIETREGSCVSLTMPTHRKGKDTEQDPLRLRNQLDEAEQLLHALGLRSSEARETLQPARDLLRDQLFWRHRGEGLALYAAPGWWRSFSTPFPLPERTVVSGRFHVRPLLAGLWPDKRFALLVLSQRHPRLYKGSRFALEAVPSAELPASLDEATRFVVAEKQLQAHIGARRGAGGGAVYHGHERDLHDDLLDEFLRAVDKPVANELRHSGLPLVLAGVDHLQHTYRGLATSTHILDEGVAGSPEHLSDDDLHRAAWSIVEPLALAERDAYRSRFAELAAKGSASHDLEHVLHAAEQARVEALLTVRDEARWGRMGANGHARIHETPRPGDEDLLDRAAVATVAAGGSVYEVDAGLMPAQAPLAAVYRY
jgi:hypothetical protein